MDIETHNDHAECMKALEASCALANKSLKIKDDYIDKLKREISILKESHAH